MAIQKVDKDEQERIKKFIEKQKNSILHDEMETGLRYMSGEMGNPNGNDSIDEAIGLEFNDINKYAEWVVSHIRQNPYSLTIEAKEDDEPIDKAIAESLQDDIDHAINSPDGQEAIECAFTTTSFVGTGFVPFELSFANKRSMDQFPIPITIKLPYNVHMGSDDSIDGSGAREASFGRSMDKDYAEQLCGKDAVGLNEYRDWQQSMYRSMKWDSNTVPDITYLYLIDKTRTQYHDSEGKVTEEKQPNGHSRDVVDTTVNIVRYIGNHKYESISYASDRLPIAAMRGFINYRSDLGEDQFSYMGYYQKCKDYQEALLYLMNEAMLIASRNSKAPYQAYEGQLEGREDEWQNSNSNGINVLLHKPVIVNGVVLPPPTRANNQGDVEWILAYAREVKRNMEDSIGINAQLMGLNDGFKETNKAVELRSSQGGMTVAPLLDNCEKSIINMGKIVTDLAIHARPKRLIKFTPKGSEEEIEQLVDLRELGASSMDFVYRPTQGPANESKRQQEFNWLMSIGVTSPEMFEQMSDLIIERSNSVANNDIVDRARDIIKMKYPNLIKDENNQEDPQVVQIMEQLTGQLQESQQMMEQVIQDADQKQQVMAYTIQSLENKLIAQEDKNNTDLVKEIMKQQAETQRNTQDNMVKLAEAQLEEGKEINLAIIEKDSALQQKELEMVKPAIEALSLQEEGVPTPLPESIGEQPQTGQNLDLETEIEND